MGQEPGLEYHFQDDIDAEGHWTYAHCEGYLRRRKTDFSLYAGSDAIMPIPIIGGIAMQVEPKRHQETFPTGILGSQPVLAMADAD